jgi:hypothetical protein
MLKEYLSSCHLFIFQGLVQHDGSFGFPTPEPGRLPDFPEGLITSEISLEPERQAEQIEDAFRKAFDAGKRKVGGLFSIPNGLETKHLEEAFLSLRILDVCIGPDQQGGIYFLGMNAFATEHFPNEWQEARVAKLHIRRLGDHKKILYRLPAL